MERIEQKKQIPQINPYSGLSDDYVSEHSPFALAYDLSSQRDAINWLIEDLASNEKNSFAVRGYLVRKYTEKFNPDVFDNVVNEKNKQAIEKLNAEVDKINMFFSENVRPLIPACREGSLTLEQRGVIEQLASMLVAISKTTTLIIQGTEKRAHQK